MSRFREALRRSGDLLIVAMMLIGFGFLLGGETGAFVAIGMIIMGFVLSLIDWIWSSPTIVGRR